MSATHRHIDTICAYYGLYRPSDLPLKNTHVALASISQPHFGKHEHMLSLWWHLIYIQPKSFFYVEIEIIIVENADSYFFLVEPFRYTSRTHLLKYIILHLFKTNPKK